MAGIRIKEILEFGLEVGHQYTEYEAYEEFDSVTETVTGLLFSSGPDSVNLLGRHFPLIRSDGSYYPPEDKFVMRIRVTGDSITGKWVYITNCFDVNGFDYTLPGEFSGITGNGFDYVLDGTFEHTDYADEDPTCHRVS